MDLKKFTLPEKLLNNIAEEFGISLDAEKKELTIPKTMIKCVKSIEEEEAHFNTFFVKETGYVYYSQPAVPLPFSVVDTTDSVIIKVHDCTEDYGLVYKRQSVNLARNLRFFVREIIVDALHFSTENQQIVHPLSK